MPWPLSSNTTPHGNTDLPTSMEKSTPPKGVPKVEATPAADAQPRISRRLEMLRRQWRKQCSRMSESETATATCTNGP